MVHKLPPVEARELSEEEHRVPYPFVASQADLRAHNIPLNWRDLCSGHFIPLRQCQLQTYHVPWKCHAEKSRWEICEYKDFLRRMRKATRLREEARINGTGPVTRIDQQLWMTSELLDIYANQDPTPGPDGPYDYVPLPKKGAAAK
ncbi:NADH-ubiquinone oxidoreductase B18 subunit-domain-containing protein, partial [Mrakia frigida]|uniref:NADH dehydrogenase [ubiquinone] 1 beta subcomplex subunit 7 n=1 Tax=Mrakia frigida TaxID=29902 RepID=UPI003FCC07FE